MNKDWEEEFDKEFPKTWWWSINTKESDRHIEAKEEIKSFIAKHLSRVLAKERTQLLARVREEVIKDIPDCSVCYGYKEILKKLEIISEEVKE